MKAVHIITWLLLLPVIFSFQPQKENDECLEMVKAIFNQMSIDKWPEGQNTYCFDFSVKTFPRSAAASAATSRVRVFMAENYLEINSGEMKLFQDTVKSFTVIPIRKLIYKNDSQLNKVKQSRITGETDISYLKAQVFDNAHIKVCRDIPGQKYYDREIILEPHIKQVTQTNIALLKVLVDSKNKSVYKSEIIYTQNAPFVKIEITYNQISFDCRRKYTGKAVGRIFSSGNKLLPEYEGYQVVDVTSMKN